MNRFKIRWINSEEHGVQVKSSSSTIQVKHLKNEIREWSPPRPCEHTYGEILQDLGKGFGEMAYEQLWLIVRNGKRFEIHWVKREVNGA